MYMAAYPDDAQQMGGLFSKIGKALKKVVKPVAHIGAAVVTGGQSLALSAKMLAADQQKKAVAAQNKAIGQAEAAITSGETPENFDATRYIKENYATANWGKGSTATKNLAKWTADPWGHWLKYGKKLGWRFPFKTGAAASTTPGMLQPTQARAVAMSVPSGDVALQRAMQTASPIGQGQQPVYYSVPSGDVALMRAGGDAGAGVPMPSSGIDTKKLMVYGGAALGAVLLVSMMNRRS